MPTFYIRRQNELYHHGIKGQKWGVRRYQNEDGTLTPEGKKRYGSFTKEYKIAKSTQRVGYKDSYSRMQDYTKKSYTVREKAKELNELSDKLEKLFWKSEDYEYDNPKVKDLAYKKAIAAAKKDPAWSYFSDSEKGQDALIDAYYYDINGGTLKKAAKEIFKADKDYIQLKKDIKQTEKEFKNKARDLTEDIIGPYANVKIVGLSDDNMDYGELVYYSLIDQQPGLYDWTYEEKIGRK